MTCSNCKYWSSSDTEFPTKEQLKAIAKFFKENDDTREKTIIT